MTAAEHDPNSECPYCRGTMTLLLIEGRKLWLCINCQTRVEANQEDVFKKVIVSSEVTPLDSGKSVKTTVKIKPEIYGDAHLIPPKFRSTQVSPTDPPICEPVGIEPKKSWIENRMLEITQGMCRYDAAGIRIPREWIAELKQLITLL